MTLLSFFNCLGFIFCRSSPSLAFPAQRSYFSTCCKVGLVVPDSLNFCLSGKLLTSPSNLKESLAGQSILGCRFFPFITLNISRHSLLACRVSVEKSADSLIGVPLYVVIFFLLFKYFIFLNFCQFDYHVSQCVPPWIYPSWDSWCFLDLADDLFPFPCLRSFQLLSLQIFSQVHSLFSFWDRYNVNVGTFNVVPEVSQAVFISFHSFFYILFCSSDLHHFVLQVIYLFFCLSYSAVDSFQCIIHLCLFFSSSRSLVNISCIFSIFASILFPRSWITFTIIILNSFSGRLPISTSFHCISGVLSCPFIWDKTFCFFHCD